MNYFNTSESNLTNLNETLTMMALQPGMTKAPHTSVMASNTGTVSPSTGTMSPDTSTVPPPTATMSPDTGIVPPPTATMSPDTGTVPPPTATIHPTTAMPTTMPITGTIDYSSDDLFG